MRSSHEQELPAIQILGVRVDCVDFRQTLDLISAWTAQSRAQAEERAKSSEKTENTSQSAGNRTENEISDGHTHSSLLTPHSSPFPRQVCTVNPEFIMAARRHPAFAQALAAADLCTPDGIGVLWAARLAGVRLDERVTGSDAIYRLCERAAAQGWRIFFLGAAPGVAERAAAELARLYPGLRVAGTYGGSPADADWPQIRQRLAAARPICSSSPTGIPARTSGFTNTERNYRSPSRSVSAAPSTSWPASPPAPRSGCAASASNGYSASPASHGAGAAWWPCRSSPSSSCCNGHAGKGSDDEKN